MKVFNAVITTVFNISLARPSYAFTSPINVIFSKLTSHQYRNRKAPRLSELKYSSPEESAIYGRSSNDDDSLRLGVLLCNLGGPERVDDVEGFLYNLFADPDIIRLPGPISFLQKPIASILSKRRAPKSKAAYDSIGGGSPILKWTNAQASALEVKLIERGFSSARCYVAMRYWHPFTSEAVDEIRNDGINKLVVLPLYPQYSISTSGSSLRALMNEFDKESYFQSDMVHTVIPSWYNRPGYISAMARLCAKEILEFTPEQCHSGITLLFSAHGVPKSYITAGDPYQSQIEECVALIENRTRDLLSGNSIPINFQLSYQSRVGPVEWLRPYTEDTIAEIGLSGKKSLVVVPISFVSEHIETLEEIDMEYRHLAKESGITNWRRVPALNTDPNFISDLCSMVIDALSAPIMTVSEAFYSNGRGKHETVKTNRSKPIGVRVLKPSICKKKDREKHFGGVSARENSDLTALQLADNAEKLAALSCLVLALDGCGREILLNAQLPLVNTFTF